MAGKIQTFGEYLRACRLEAGYGLRRFANMIEMKASNLCDVEYGRREMPEPYMEPAAEALGLRPGTKEWERFFDLAGQSRGLAPDVLRIARGPYMPALLRTVDNLQLSEAEIRGLIAEIREREREPQDESM